MAVDTLRKWLQLTVALVLLLSFGGCVKETTSGDEQVFQYETWLPVTLLLAGIAAVPLGLVLRAHTARLGWGLIIAGPIAAIGFAPSLFLDTVRVNNKGFHTQGGIWGMTSVHDVEFATVHQIRITAEVTTGRRGKKTTNYYLNCDKRSGESIKVPMNNEVKQGALEAILSNAAANNIAIVDDTGGK